jgi:hypothetical protein
VKPDDAHGAPQGSVPADQGALHDRPRSAGAAGALPALAALSVAIVAMVLVDAIHPSVVFVKYLAAARAPASERAARILDYSPLYLALTTLLLPWGPAAILAFQGMLHALTAAAAARFTALLAPRGWPWLAGCGVALYRPLLTYVSIHEPETTIVFVLALAVLAGGEARSRLGGDGPRRAAVWVILAFVGLSLATLARPTSLLLFPAWVGWMGSALSRPRRRGVVWIVTAAVAVGAVVLVPPLASRARLSGTPVIMNPGPVFYEGNSPGATGLNRYAPLALIALEHGGPGRIDYGHVAYRRIASFATGHSVSPAASTRYWARLGWPGDGSAARRCSPSCLTRGRTCSPPSSASGGSAACCRSASLSPSSPSRGSR